MLSIPCCLVDNHCDVVPFLQQAWKSGHLPFSGLKLVHVDSHPDLVPPQLSTSQLRSNELLLRTLEGEGGISEFIIPLIVNGHVTEGMVWLKPPWSSQIPCGHHRLLVGDICASGKDDELYVAPKCATLPSEPGAGEIRVNEMQSAASTQVMGMAGGLSYYLDDGYDCDPHSLTNTTAIQLTVLEAPDADRPPAAPIVDATPWILDICLDYFFTVNPFVNRLRDIFIFYDPANADRLLTNYKIVFSTVAYRAGPPSGIAPEQARLVRLRFKETFRLCVMLSGIDCCNSDQYALNSDGSRRLLKDTVCCVCTANAVPTGGGCRSCIIEQLKESLMSFFSDRSDIDVRECVSELLEFFGLLNALSLKKSEVGIIDLHKQTLYETGCLCLLPDTRDYLSAGLADGALDHAEIQRLVLRMVESMIRTLDGPAGLGGGNLRSHPPVAVCLARSDGDGYTPLELVDYIQDKVIAALRSKLGEMEAGGENIHQLMALHDICDIREDPVERSRMLFVDFGDRFRNFRSYPARKTNKSGLKRKYLEESGYRFDK